ncbi:MAG: phage tail tape measure protein [Candidatus Ornithomonoglobus sp.]
MADKTISVEITGDASGLQAAVGQAQSALSNLEGSNKSASTSTQKNSSEIEKNTSAVGKNTSAAKEAAAAKDNQTKSTQKNETATKTSTTAVDKNTEAVKKNSKETETAQKKQVSFSEKATESGRRWKEAGEGIDQMTKPLQRAAIATAAAGVASAKAAIDFEDNFANVKKTVEGTPEQLEAVKQGIIDMTTVGVNGHNAIPQTTAQLTELAAAGGQLGITTDNIIDFTEVMAQMGTATNLAGEEGAATLARFMNVTNTDQSKIRNLGSSIVDLGNNFATTEAEIASLALRMGETGGVIGISAQDILGYSTALSSMGIQAEAGGSAVSRIWMTMQKAVAGGDESLEKFAKVSGKSSKEFAEQWKNDASGAFQDFIKGLSESEDQISTLDELGFGNIRDIAALQALASTKGIELMTDALERSNKAWEENTALQTEADTKAQTTAGQLAITKNNIVETARSLGEVMLPTITDVSAGVRTFAQNLNEMSDSEKEAVIKTAAVTVGLAALAKGTAGTIKTVGTITEGVGKLTKSVPGISEIGTAIKAGLTSPLGIAALAAVGLGIAAKGAYDSWYKSNYKWSEGLSEGNKKVQDSLDKYKKITALKKEVQELQSTITNPNASTEQVDQAKAKLEEIKALLAEEYHLVIKSDNSNLDEAIDTAQKLSKNELQTNINNQMSKLSSLREKMASYDGDYNADYSKYQNALNEQTKYSDMKNSLSEINTEFKNGNITLAERNNKVKELAKSYGFADEVANSYGRTVSAIDKGYSYYTGQVGKYAGRLGDLIATQEEYVAVSAEMANWNTELLNIAALEGDSESAQKALSNIGNLVRAAGLDMSGYAQAASLAMNNVQNLDEAWQKGGATLDGVTNDYIRAMKEFGASAQDTAIGAALIKNGFHDIGEAANAGGKAINNTATNAIEYMTNWGLTAEQAADHMISALQNVGVKGGDIVDIINDSLSKLGKNDGHLELTAEGKITWVSDEVEEPDVPDAEGKVNYEAGEVEEPDVPDAEGNVKWESDTSEPDSYQPEIKDSKAIFTVEHSQVDAWNPNPKNSNAIYAPEHSQVDAWQPPTKHGTVIYSVKSIIGSVTAGASGKTVKLEADGTDNFPGGLAMVNDQKGIADPRELIIDKGNAFIPNGRDVILPLSKGAKIYTASQTKRIMEGLGIPRYASGKDNSDEFTEAAGAWAHYTKTHPVSTGGELQQWLDFQKQYKENAEDIKVIEEEIFLKSKEAYDEQMAVSAKWIEHEEKYNALSYEGKVDAIKRVEEKVQKAYDKGLITEREYLDTIQEWDEEYLDSFMEMIDKKRGESADYIALRALKNDWDALEDDPFAAYSRVKERERWMVETTGDWETYYSNMSELSDDMLDDMVSQTKEALELQQKYFGLSAKEYLNGIDDMIAKTDEFYNNLDVSEAKRAEMDKELYTLRLDAQRAIYDEYIKYADSYYNIREAFDDWDEVGDSKSQYYAARLKNLETMYKEGVMNPRDYMDNTVNEYLNMYKAVSEEYDNKLQAYQDKMSQISSDYSDRRSKLTSEYEQKTRTADLDEVNRLLDIYENAVTDSGQQKYQDLLDQKKQLLYQQELADLEADEQAELDDIQALYDATEQEKKRVLSKMRADTYGISSGIDELAETTFDVAQLTAAFSQATVDYAEAVAGKSGLLNELISSVNKISSKIGTASSSNMTYNNNGSYTFQIANDTQALIKKLTGTIASGLGSVMIGGF